MGSREAALKRWAVRYDQLLSEAQEGRGPNECWPWPGVLLEGYARFGRRSVTRMLMNAPPDKLVRHTCDNPPCVNRRHLLLGTQFDNMRDACERGRFPSRKGITFPNRKRPTHCKRNHELNEKNAYTNPNTGRRTCRVCRQLTRKD